jgi:hypothetical protein
VQDGPGVLVAWFSRAPVDLWRWEPVRAPAGEALAARLDDLLGPRLDALCEQSRHLAHPECVEELHRLRLAGKQVRYAFELVRPCLAGDVEPAHKRLRRLQDRLGQVHDADLWTARLLERLRASLRRLRRGRKRLSARARAADPDLAKVARELAAELAEPALPGLALLVADVAQERGKAWRKLRELWTRMERDEVLQTLRDALAAPPPPAPAPTPLPESPQPPRAAAPAPSETASRFPLFSPPPAAAPAPAPRDPPAAPPPAP